MDNSDNAHGIKDKLLFIRNIFPCSIGTDAGIVIGEDKLKVIGVTKIK